MCELSGTTSRVKTRGSTGTQNPKEFGFGLLQGPHLFMKDWPSSQASWKLALLRTALILISLLLFLVSLHI